MSRYTGLGDIEDGEVIGLSAPAGMAPIGLSTPPRPAAVPTAADAPTDEAVGEGLQPKPRKKPARPRPGKPALTAGPLLTRATTTDLPVSTVELINRNRQQQRLSAGEVIVIAIEAQYDNLADLLRTPRRTGLFETHAARLPRRDDEPLQTISYRLTETDIATIDSLVEQFGARSRSHLIKVAVNAHYR